jgi:hypothetical protein
MSPIRFRHKSGCEKFPYDLSQIWQGAVIPRRFPPSAPVTRAVFLAQPTGRETG